MRPLVLRNVCSTMLAAIWGDTISQAGWVTAQPPEEPRRTMLGGELPDGGAGVRELAAAQVQLGLFVPDQAFQGGSRVFDQHQAIGRLAHEPGPDEGLEGLGRQAETPPELFGVRRKPGGTRAKNAPIELLGVGGDLKDGQVRAHGGPTLRLTVLERSVRAMGAAIEAMCGRLGPLAGYGHSGGARQCMM